MSIRKGQTSELENEFAPEKLPRQYSNTQLNDFWRGLEPFYEEKTLDPRFTKSGEAETIRVLNIQEAMVAAGAMRKRMHLGVPTYAVVMENDGNNRDGRPRFKTPTKMEIWMDKYEQAQRLNGRREYAQKQELKEYEAMAAENMRFIPNTDYDETESA